MNVQRTRDYVCPGVYVCYVSLGDQGEDEKGKDQTILAEVPALAWTFGLGYSKSQIFSSIGPMISLECGPKSLCNHPIQRQLLLRVIKCTNSNS